MPLLNSKPCDRPMASVLTETELAVRTENVPDAERLVLSIVLDAGVNVRALCSYGDGSRIVVLVVPEDAQGAKRALTCAGFECKANPVIVVGLQNRVGAVAQLGAHLYNAGVEILRSYASYMDETEVVAVFKTHDDARAVEVLQASLHADAQSDVQPAAA